MPDKETLQQPQPQQRGEEPSPEKSREGHPREQLQGKMQEEHQPEQPRDRVEEYLYPQEKLQGREQDQEQPEKAHPGPPTELQGQEQEQQEQPTKAKSETTAKPQGQEQDQQEQPEKANSETMAKSQEQERDQEQEQEQDQLEQAQQNPTAKSLEQDEDQERDQPEQAQQDPTAKSQEQDEDQEQDQPEQAQQDPTVGEIVASNKSNRSGEFLLHSIYHDLLANVLLLAGHVFLLWFGVYEFTGRAREPFPIFCYYLGFVLLIASGSVELSVDVRGIRAEGHGRYHCSGKSRKITLSCLFIAAGILDIVAFVYWTRRQRDIENLVLLVSAYCLLAMAILTLIFQKDELREMSWAKVKIQEKLDLIANCIVLVVVVLMLVFRHMDNSGKDFGDTPNEIELATLPIWLFSSMLYVATDVITYKGATASLDSHS